MSSLLSVENLFLKDLLTGNDVLKNISFQLNEKEILGVVGESGSGKTLLSQAIVNWLPENLEISTGEINFLDKKIPIAVLAIILSIIEYIFSYQAIYYIINLKKKRAGYKTCPF